ncbi:hypothetical protein BpHYR1_027008 [Brachionus plicatilis]|uniref:Secreted protein n=1 Tax=Brachionus plicatilis TaxID=10195 RepID=A0A3M7SP88_BRAPC|nr:hypothetical protein BpHYR1_027008 [Brachionus plicatilis]
MKYHAGRLMLMLLMLLMLLLLRLRLRLNGLLEPVENNFIVLMLTSVCMRSPCGKLYRPEWDWLSARSKHLVI